MAADARVDARQLHELSRALRAAGDKELRKQLNKRIREGVRPLTPITRAAARRILPRKGGLAELTAKAPQRVQIRTGRESAGVRLSVGRKGSGASADTDTLRHPVFGKPNSWVNQKVEPGWFSGTLQEHAPGVRPEVEQAIRDVRDELARRVRGAG